MGVGKPHSARRPTLTLWFCTWWFPLLGVPLSPMVNPRKKIANYFPNFRPRAWTRSSQDGGCQEGDFRASTSRANREIPAEQGEFRRDNLRYCLVDARWWLASVRSKQPVFRRFDKSGKCCRIPSGAANPRTNNSVEQKGARPWSARRVLLRLFSLADERPHRFSESGGNAF